MFIFFHKGERELVLSFPLLFLVTLYTFYQLKNKKQKVELAMKQRKMNPPYLFFLQDFWRSAAKWEILNSEKIPTFLSALFILCFWFMFLEWKEFPVTHNKRGALLSYLLIHSFIHSFSNVHRSGNEILHHLAPRKVACNSPYLDRGGSGCLNGTCTGALPVLW